jgi:soluble lytic murein transglycosylase-like protein
VAALRTTGDATALAALAARLGAAAPAANREIEARTVELLAASSPEVAIERGLKLLRGGTGDDPADRVATVLHRPEWLARYPPETLVLLGETARGHRHYDRAVALLTAALRALPARADDLLFSIGRAHFGAEQFEIAERIYLQGAEGARDAEARGNFLYHAARCAQLRGDDAAGEKHLTAAIQASGRSDRAAVALTQRIRIRIKKGNIAAATEDLRAVQKRHPRSHSVVDAVLAYSTGLIAAGRNAEALRELEGVKLRLLTRQDGPEINYWRARALEKRNPEAAIKAYLKVLRATFPTHFAYLARRRFRDEPLAAHVRKRNRRDAVEVERLRAAGDAGAARSLQTDVVLLAPASEQAKELETLRRIYAVLPAYQNVLSLPEPAFPRFPLWSPPGSDPGAAPDRHDLLLAMGLFDDAAALIPTRYALHPLGAGVARSEALRRAGSSRLSIYAVEVAREEVPDDYVPQLLPELVRQLLYPRYFYDTISRQAQEHGADPRLVLAIMREESRFNPRAKSAAAARGLLQFIITTAREVGRAVGLVAVEPEDLYDPEVIIRLGARYIADLLKQFGGDPYKAAAAYNAGPRQSTLWTRMAAAPGEDYFLSSITFEETKDYVRKVLNSYYRYGEIYGHEAPSGGVRAEP